MYADRIFVGASERGILSIHIAENDIVGSCLTADHCFDLKIVHDKLFAIIGKNQEIQIVMFQWDVLKGNFFQVTFYTYGPWVFESSQPTQYYLKAGV
jgi:hypothetical protein